MAGADIEVVMCPELLAEIAEVLTMRERLRRWISLENAEAYVEMIATLVDLVPDPPDEDHGVRDIEDTYLVSLARDNGAATSSSQVTRTFWNGNAKNPGASRHPRSSS